MEEQIFKKEDTLLSALGYWNKVEQLCAGVYGEQVLKDRAFQRLKMQEYQRLYNKYGGKEHPTLDEQALHKMLRYQHRKIEQHLYPNPVRRLVQRAVDNIVSGIGKKLHGDVAPSAFDTGNTSIPESFIAAREKITDLPGQNEDQAQQQRPEAWWVQDLGQKDKKAANEKKLGIH